MRTAVLALSLVAGARMALGVEPGSVVVLANSAGPLAGATAEEIREIFLGKVRMVGDVRVQPVLLDGVPQEVVLRSVLGMSVREFRLHWMRKSYEDGLLPPPVQSSSESVVQYVAGEKGAIGFVDASSFRRTDQVTVVYEVHPDRSAP